MRFEARNQEKWTEICWKIQNLKHRRIFPENLGKTSEMSAKRPENFIWSVQFNLRKIFRKSIWNLRKIVWKLVINSFSSLYSKDAYNCIKFISNYLPVFVHPWFVIVIDGRLRFRKVMMKNGENSSFDVQNIFRLIILAVDLSNLAVFVFKLYWSFKQRGKLIRDWRDL